MNRLPVFHRDKIFHDIFIAEKSGPSPISRCACNVHFLPADGKTHGRHGASCATPFPGASADSVPGGLTGRPYKERMATLRGSGFCVI